MIYTLRLGCQHFEVMQSEATVPPTKFMVNFLVSRLLPILPPHWKWGQAATGLSLSPFGTVAPSAWSSRLNAEKAPLTNDPRRIHRTGHSHSRKSNNFRLFNLASRALRFPSFPVYSFQFSASSSGPLWSTLCHALLTIVSQQIKKRLDTAQQPPAEICGDTFYANCSAHKNTHTHGCTVHTTHSHGAKVQSPQRKYSHEKRTQRCMWLPASI